MVLNDLFRKMASVAGPDEHADVVVSDACMDGLAPRSGHAGKGQAYVESGQQYYEERYRERVVHNLTKRTPRLGLVITPASSSSSTT